MRSIKRSAAPVCLGNGDVTAPAPRLAWYGDIYKKDGSIKDRWNSQELDELGVSSIRKLLRAMSDERCAWCERQLQQGWQVDHWLPDKKFPLVAYYWDNLLPSCPGCNRRKSAITPAEWNNKKIIDPILSSLYPDATVFEKSVLLPVMAERLVDPSFDEPTQHIEFVVPALTWRGLTVHGEFTIRHLFSERSDAEEWAKLSCMIKDLVSAPLPSAIFDSLIDHVLGLFGQPTIIKSMIAYWRDLLGRASPVATSP